MKMADMVPNACNFLPFSLFFSPSSSSLLFPSSPFSPLLPHLTWTSVPQLERSALDRSATLPCFSCVGEHVSHSFDWLRTRHVTDAKHCQAQGCRSQAFPRAGIDGEGFRTIRSLRWPGIEPGSTAWKAAMLTTIPPTPGVSPRDFYSILPLRQTHFAR